MDLETARDFYEAQKTGLGQYFISCLLADLESLMFYAGIHARHFGLLRMLAKRFPYAVYYEVEDSVVAVLAVLDMRQEPTALVHRLAGRNPK